MEARIASASRFGECGLAADSAPLDGCHRHSGDKALRDAYLSRLREHPPERDPEGFERIRDAYLALTSPEGRMRRWFDDEALKHIWAFIGRGNK